MLAHLVPEILHHLMMLYIPTLIGIYTVSITLMSFYNIDRKVHAENLRKLEALAAAEAAPPVGP